jgi:hypothetical protein
MQCCGGSGTVSPSTNDNNISAWKRRDTFVHDESPISIFHFVVIYHFSPHFLLPRVLLAVIKNS